MLEFACRKKGAAPDLSSLLVSSCESWTPHQAPLHCAARLGRTEALQVILQGGADPNAADAEHVSAIQKALDKISELQGSLDTHRAAWISARLALVDATGAVAQSRGWRAAASSPFAIAAAEAALQEALSAEQRCTDEVKRAADAFQAVDDEAREARDAHASLVVLCAAPLHLVAFPGCERLAGFFAVPAAERVCVCCNAEVVLPTEEEAGSAVESARLLLDAGADVNAVDKSGRTPLHWAARSGNLALVRGALTRLRGAFCT